VVNSQLKFIRQHDIGFDKEQIMVIENYEGDMKSRYSLLKDYVRQLPGVNSITCGSDIPLYGVSNWGGPCVASNKQISMQGCGFISVDENYLDMIGAKIKEGRGFIRNNASEKNKIIITEALARSLNLINPVGVKLGDLWDNTSREIVGVVKDIEFNTIHSKSVPVVFFYKRDYIRYHERIMIKLQSENITGVIGCINKYWQKISPDYPMDYKFLDDQFNRNYLNESRTSVFMNVMAIVAVILCCMGLFGLALFHINARIKEIGIRKVNGAKVIEVIQMLNSDFVEWIIIAFVVAAPIAWFVLHKWLQSFAYKTELSWWVFILAGIITLLVAVFTVSWQSYKAAVMNPVESLRYE
jgi:putative ABC transport system permease protein